MVYTVFYKTSSFAGYCFLDKNSIHPKRYGVFSFNAFKAILVKIQICSFIVLSSFILCSTSSYFIPMGKRPQIRIPILPIIN